MGVPPSAWLSRASFLFACGSALLLLGAIVFARAAAFGGAILLTVTWFAVIVHGLGWYVLYEGAPRGADGRAIHALGGSAVLFLVGLVAMAALAPPDWTPLFFAFPYVPLLFGPVVLVHARLFLSSAASLPPGHEQTLIRAGSLVLIVLALVGIAAQLVHLAIGVQDLARMLGGDGASIVTQWTFFPYPAGLTVVGYALAWWGWSAIGARERDAAGPGPAPQASP
ncbi:MAG: hypothetical protein ACT4OI_01595 [Methanobacteriota archaeon]